MLYPDELIEEIRINNDIVDVVSEYVRLEKKGKYFFGLCPFHKEKTPSFSVSPLKQIFYCFGCNKGGNVIQFIMNIENLDYIEAIKLLADRAKIDLPESGDDKELAKARLRQELLGVNIEAARFYHERLNSEIGNIPRKYLSDRGLKDQTLRRFGLGYASDEWDLLYRHLLNKNFNDELIIKSGLVLKGKNGRLYDKFRERVIFPIFDVRGNVIAFGGRVMNNSLPKYMNSPETAVYNKGRNLYALNFAKNSGEKKLVVVEGYMDVISLHQNGIINAVASLGTALTENQGRLLKKYTEEIVISYDSDTAGQAATLRGLDLLNEIGCNVKVLEIPQGKDPDEYVRKNGAEQFRKLIDSSFSLIEYKVRRLKAQIDTETTDGKIHFLNRAADVLSKVDNSLEREMYVKKLAKEYGISEESIISEIIRRIKPKAGTKISFSSNREGRKDRTGTSKDTCRIVHDERFVLALVCLDNSLFPIVRGKLPLDLYDRENREIAAIIYGKLENKSDMNPAELMNMLDNEAAADFSRIINEECYCEDNRKAILGKIKSIELYKAERRQKEVVELLTDKESLQEGDVETLKQELRELLVLIKGLKME